MAEPSPAARAVMDAVKDAFSELVLSLDESPISTGAMSLMAAAALRAAANAVVPEQTREPHGTGFRWGGWAGQQGARRDLLAIATELEGANA